MWRGSSTAISKRLFKLLNDQGNREYEASLLYAASAIWFQHNELSGSAAWCKTHSDEERMHAQKIFDHLASRRIEEDLLVGLEEREGKGKEEGPIGTVGGGAGSAAAQEAEEETRTRKPALSELKTEAVPQASETFQWETTPNVTLDVKGPTSTTFANPTAVWRTALEHERQNSKRFFQLMAAARETQDFVTEHFILTFFIPEQLEEEKAVEEIFTNTLLVTKKGPEFYLELDKVLPTKPH